MSRRRSPVTPTNVKLAVQLAIRHSKLSAVISDMSRMRASQTLAAWDEPAESPSTRFFTPYCVPTEHATAPTTAVRITAWAARRRRRYRNTNANGRFAYPERLSMFAVRLLKFPNGIPARLSNDRSSLAVPAPRPSPRYFCDMEGSWGAGMAATSERVVVQQDVILL